MLGDWYLKRSKFRSTYNTVCFTPTAYCIILE